MLAPSSEVMCAGTCMLCIGLGPCSDRQVTQVASGSDFIYDVNTPSARARPSITTPATRASPWRTHAALRRPHA
eukprot:3932442-Rhodomonas_salina.2